MSFYKPQVVRMETFAPFEMKILYAASCEKVKCLRNKGEKTESAEDNSQQEKVHDNSGHPL
jgi:hypothetical protein